MCAQWVAKDLKLLQATSEDSDHQSDLSLRWAHTRFIGFIMQRMCPSARGHSIETQPMNCYGSLSQYYNQDNAM